MSQIETIKTSGIKDKGCITPEEIVRFCIEHNVDRINYMRNIWKGTKKDEEGNIIDTRDCGINEMSDYEKEGFVFECVNEWEIDFN